MTLKWIFIVAVLPLAASTALGATITPTEILDTWSEEGDPRSGNIVGVDWAVIDGELRSRAVGAIVSNFTVVGDFTFSGRLRTTNPDDDLMGFAWGWQDPDNNYRFGWDAFFTGLGAGDLIGNNGVPNLGSDVNGLRVLEEAGGTNTFHYQESPTPTPWEINVYYDFLVSRSGSDYTVTVMQGATVFLDTTFTDTTFTSGRLALYSSSQSDVLFSSIDFTPIPEPNTALLLSLGLTGLSWKGRRSLRS
jgi:hypothetical protein